MSIKLNCNRSGCKDVFKVFLVENAKYDGEIEIPVINPIEELPQKIISFTEINKTKDYNQWIHFYVDDFHFEKVWYKIKNFVKLFKKFNGVILPDFSVYRDMPLCMQYWNIYRSRAIGNYLQNIGIKVIANIRYGDERTYECCCFGVPHNSIIAIGTNGVVKNLKDREYLNNGFEYIVKKIYPKTIIVYGTVTEYIRKISIDNNIKIINFKSSQYDRYRGA